MKIQTILKNEFTQTPVTLEKLGDSSFALCGWEFSFGEFWPKEIILGKSFPTEKKLVKIAREYFDGNECKYELPSLEDLL